MLVKSGDYRYVVTVKPLTPPMAGKLKYVASVEQIVKPGIGGPEVSPVQIGECYGETESEAIAEAKVEAEAWIRNRSSGN